MAQKVDQQSLHAKAINHISDLKEIIDQLKNLGPHELDSDNTLLNIREQLESLSRR
jgi:hypothetical protein